MIAVIMTAISLHVLGKIESTSDLGSERGKSLLGMGGLKLQDLKQNEEIWGVLPLHRDIICRIRIG